MMSPINPKCFNVLSAKVIALAAAEAPRPHHRHLHDHVAAGIGIGKAETAKVKRFKKSVVTTPSRMPVRQIYVSRSGISPIFLKLPNAGSPPAPFAACRYAM